MEAQPLGVVGQAAGTEHGPNNFASVPHELSRTGLKM